MPNSTPKTVQPLDKALLPEEADYSLEAPGANTHSYTGT
jgi:hypothetical protein